jgi:uncharacterized protein
MSASVAPTTRTTLRRKADRGRHDRALVHAIVDEALFCHVAVTTAAGPLVLPTVHARVGDHVYLHGATGNALLRTMAEGGEACVAFTLVDGLVLSRSWFHHSMNYRSVVVFGRPERVEDPGEKRAALQALVDHVVPGRSTDTRSPTPEELRATLVVRLSLDEASAKVRTGPPGEEPADLDLDTWAGELPLTLRADAPVPDPHLRDPRQPPPASVTHWTRP